MNHSYNFARLIIKTISWELVFYFSQKSQKSIFASVLRNSGSEKNSKFFKVIHKGCVGQNSFVYI